MSESPRDDDSCAEASVTHAGRASRNDVLVKRLSRYGVQVMPGASPRRSRLQRQPEDGCPPGGLQRDAPDGGSLTPALRKKPPSGSIGAQTAEQRPPDQDPDWDLYRMEHEWMLSAVEGNYDTILEFLSGDPHLLTRRDFISGYSVLHWLAKRGEHETLIGLLRHAEKVGLPVNVNLRGSGGLTPLHVASMHGQYMVVKLLVGAFGADVDVMDYSGRRAWRYLRADAPPEMRELLGTWDDDHGTGDAQGSNRNGNNNCVEAQSLTGCEQVESAEPEDVDQFARTERAVSWRFGSFRKLLPAFSFLGGKF